MCGRYGTTMTMREAARRLGVDAGKLLAGEIHPTYNAAPGTAQLTAIGRLDDPTNLELTRTRWGFLPSWQTHPSKSSINMRVESSAKRYWSKAFLRRRCVVPANWWYEWERVSGDKQPYAIRPRDTVGFFFAGVWSVAKGLPENHPLHNSRTFALVTKPALPAIEHIHPRMPIVLEDVSARQWLKPAESVADLHAIANGGSPRRYEAWPISSRVNKPGNDDASLLERIGRAEPK